jgi:geranylgeranyl reductase family protein
VTPIDVVIAGAGPAGIGCAVALVRRRPDLAGRIVVLDRARFPRDKPCGGGLTGHALDAMRALGLRVAVPAVDSPRAVVSLGVLRREVALPRPVTVVRRTEFDASLVDQARALGVEVREHAALRDFRVRAGGVDLDTSAGPLRARALVGADGAASVVRKRLARPSRTPLRLIRAELPAGSARWDDVMLYDFTPMADGLRGYLWIFPMPDGRLNVGVMHAPNAPLPGGDLVPLLRRRLDALGVRLDAAPRGWPAWPFATGDRLAVPHVLLVGDAAGIDALTGEGIAVGLEQAMVAAETIADGLLRDDLRFSGYTSAVARATVGRELRLDDWLARLLYGRGWARWCRLAIRDPSLLHRYAERIAGTTVLADRKLEILRALLRSLLHPPGT